MLTFRTVFLSAIAALGLIVSAHAQGVDDKQAEAFTQKWMQTFAKKDPAEMANLYVEDAVYVSFTGVYTGRDQIRQQYENQFKAGYTAVDTRVTKRQSLGPEHYYAYGEATLKGSGQGGPANVDVRWFGLYKVSGDNIRAQSLTITPKGMPQRSQ